jgi:phage terminase large subunit-like protein
MSYDRSGWLSLVAYLEYTSIALELEKEGVRMVELPQTSARVEADQALYDAIIGKTLRHYGDATLDEHIRNAIAVETPRGYRLAKEKTSKKIDAAVALSMAHHGSLCEETTWWIS